MVRLSGLAKNNIIKQASLWLGIISVCGLQLQNLDNVAFVAM